MASRTLANSLTSRSLFRQSNGFTIALQRYTDIALICALLYGLVLWKTGSFPVTYQLLALLTMVLMAAVYHISGVYKSSDRKSTRELCFSLGLFWDCLLKWEPSFSSLT